MPNGIAIELKGDKELEAQLKKIATRGTDREAANLVNRLAFEALDSLEEESRSEFSFSGPTTERFLSRAFVFDKARAEQRPQAVIYPKRGRERILEENVFGSAVVADKGRLTFGDKIAIPVKAKRTRRGRVPKSQAPGTVVDRRNVFVLPGGGAIVRRTKEGTEVLYVLVDEAKMKPRFDFAGTIQRSVIKALPKKAARILEKMAQARSDA